MLLIYKTKLQNHTSTFTPADECKWPREFGKGCIPNEYGNFWRGRGREILFYYILGEEILALPVMIVLLDKNVLGEIEN